MYSFVPPKKFLVSLFSASFPDGDTARYLGQFDKIRDSLLSDLFNTTLTVLPCPGSLVFFSHFLLLRSVGRSHLLSLAQELKFSRGV